MELLSALLFQVKGGRKVQEHNAAEKKSCDSLLHGWRAGWTTRVSLHGKRRRKISTSLCERYENSTPHPGAHPQLKRYISVHLLSFSLLSLFTWLRRVVLFSFFPPFFFLFFYSMDQPSPKTYTSSRYYEVHFIEKRKGRALLYLKRKQRSAFPHPPLSSSTGAQCHCKLWLSRITGRHSSALLRTIFNRTLIYIERERERDLRIEKKVIKKVESPTLPLK